MLKAFDSLFQTRLFAPWLLFFLGGCTRHDALAAFVFSTTQADAYYLYQRYVHDIGMTYGHDDYDNDHDHCDFYDYQCGHDRDYDRGAHEYDILVLHT